MMEPSSTRLILLLAVLLVQRQIPSAFAENEPPSVLPPREFHHVETLQNLSFGSCHKRKYAQTNPHSIWDSIRQENPQAFLWMGDAVYPPERGIASIESLQREYHQLSSNDTLGYSKLSCPVYGTWDDHDYGGNDAGKEMPQKQQRAQAFWEFLKLPSPPPQQEEGIYSQITWGEPPQQVQILLLDTRSFRQAHCIPSVATYIPILGPGIACVTRWLSMGLSYFAPNTAQWWSPLLFWCNPNRSLLGDEQWNWLESKLKHRDDSTTPPPQLTILVSSIQVLSTNPVMEIWGHFPHEWKRLVELLHSTQHPVVLLSGDVHYAEILQPTPHLLEVTSSGLTHDCSQPFYGAICQPLLQHYGTNRKQIDDVYIGRNYGFLQVDWNQSQFEVDIRDFDGKTVLTTGWKSLSATEPSLEFPAVAADGHLWPWVLRLVLTLVVAVFLAFRFTQT